MKLNYFYKVSYDSYTKKVTINEYIGDFNIFKEYLKNGINLEDIRLFKYTESLEDAKDIACQLYKDNFLEDIRRDIEYFDYCIKNINSRKNIFNFIRINKDIKQFEDNKIRKENLLKENSNFLIVKRIPVCLNLDEIIKDDKNIYIVNNYVNKTSKNTSKEYIKSSIIHREINRYNILYITYDTIKQKINYKFSFENINENIISIPGYSVKAFFKKEDANKYCQEKISDLENIKSELIEFIESD